VALEMREDMFNLCKKYGNAARSAAQKFLPLHAAASVHSGRGAFFPRKDRWMSITNCVSQNALVSCVVPQNVPLVDDCNRSSIALEGSGDRYKDKKDEISIPFITLDNVWEQHFKPEKIDLLKVDAEVSRQTTPHPPSSPKSRLSRSAQFSINSNVMLVSAGVGHADSTEWLS
jgi:hypothetical protein